MKKDLTVLELKEFMNRAEGKRVWFRLLGVAEIVKEFESLFVYYRDSNKLGIKDTNIPEQRVALPFYRIDRIKFVENPDRTIDQNCVHILYDDGTSMTVWIRD